MTQRVNECVRALKEALRAEMADKKASTFDYTNPKCIKCDAEMEYAEIIDKHPDIECEHFNCSAWFYCKKCRFMTEHITSYRKEFAKEKLFKCKDILIAEALRKIENKKKAEENKDDN